MSDEDAGDPFSEEDTPKFPPVVPKEEPTRSDDEEKPMMPVFKVKIEEEENKELPPDINVPLPPDLLPAMDTSFEKPKKKKRNRKRKRSAGKKATPKSRKKKKKKKKEDVTVKEEEVPSGPVLDHNADDGLETPAEAENKTTDDMALGLTDTNLIQAPKRLSIYNVVCTFRTGCNLDLKKIASRLRNTNYNPRRFPAVIIRHIGNDNFPKSTALIFKSGKVVLTGAKSTNLAHLAARKYTRLFQRLDFKAAKFCDFKIHNLVCGLSLPFKVRLEGLFMAAMDKISYEPEIFPGLIYRMKDPKVTILVFVSGEVVLVGAKSVETCRKAIKILYPQCVKHKAPKGFEGGKKADEKKAKKKAKKKKGKKEISKFPKIPKWLPT